MTARQIFEGMLIELSKVNAPSLLLQDFNYLFNKAINQYVNKRYNIYDITQQTTDDLRVLTGLAVLTPKESRGLSKVLNKTYEVELPNDYLHMLNCICVYKMDRNFKCYNKDEYVSFAAKRLTADAWSTIINDFYNRPLPERPYVFIHNVNQQNELPTNLYNSSISGSTDLISGASIDYSYKIVYLTPPDTSYNLVLNVTGIKRKSQYEYSVPVGTLLYNIIKQCYPDLLDTDEVCISNDVSQNNTNCIVVIINNDIRRFLQINANNHLIELLEELVLTNIGSSHYETFLHLEETVGSISIELPRSIDLYTVGSEGVDLVDKPAYIRHSNPTSVRAEIRYGKDNSVFKLVEVVIDYIKSPLHIRLTQEQLDMTEDTSQIMEFPDYVCQEIINELVLIVMENTSDPRLQSHVAVSLSIASPAQQLTTNQAQTS